ncbi:MAG: helix-turn-helix domain-containing protein [Acidimicrobiaceae bacterium]|nr:helix-turn-helix domain-containing protein [Acidimicrobiaceae bacterium]
MTRFSDTPITGHPDATDHPDDDSLLTDIDAAGARAGQATTIEALRHQNELLRQTIVLCDRLTAMALRGDGLASITAQFSRMIGHGVVVLDPMLSPIASAGWDRDPAGDADPLGLAITYQRLRGVLAGAPGPLRLPSVPGIRGPGGSVIAPITVGNRLLGYVAVASPEEPVTGDLDLFAVQHAATVYAQALLEEDRVGAFRLRFRREIFEGLLRGHDGGEDAVESARLIGLDPDQTYQVVAIAAEERPADDQPTHDRLAHDRPAHDRPTHDRPARHRATAPERAPHSAGALVLETVVNALNHRWPDLIAVIQDEELIVVAPPRLSSTRQIGSPEQRAGDDDRLGACLLAFLASRFGATRFTIGASQVTNTLSQLGTARDQARATLKLARRLGRTEAVTAYEELGFYRLLLAVPPPELRRFADEVLAPLVDYDEAHGTNLVSTLAAYLQTGGSPRHAAEKLFVHPNTVVYRIGRIQELIGLDLADPEDRLLCQAAVKGREALEYRHAGSGPSANGPSGAELEDRK